MRSPALLLNMPELFKHPDFVEWLNGPGRKFTWHNGGAPTEWSDLVVCVDPSLNGEGSDSDMPEHCWHQILDACRAEWPNGLHQPEAHIMVRLTNMEV